ncbi:helix-turn-helix domain-containing protein [Nonomuraea bangladeshensis]|uniref:helix-turn-helix domain-containing protein n=1 Tax=Nonomuraea bangladeshensis TaxID=404385 RepID=UPI003C2DE549
MPARKQLNVDALVKAYEAGASVRALAAHAGVSHAAIHRTLKGRTKMRPVGGRTGSQLIPQETRDKIAAAYEADTPMADIIATFGVCDETVRRIADEAEIPRRPVGGQQRLDRDQIAELGRQDWPAEAIAVLVGASPSRVRTILRELAERPAEGPEADTNGPGQ